MNLNPRRPEELSSVMTGRMTRRDLLKRSLVLGVSAPVVAGLLAACGSRGTSTSNTGARTGTATRTATKAAGTPTKAAGTPTKAAASPTKAAGTPTKAAASPTKAAGTPTSGAKQAVTMNDQLKFVPATITIKVGDTITWTNSGTIAHTTTADPAKAAKASNVALPSGAKTWDSGLLNAGQSFSHTFDVAGVYKYICIPHEAAGMLGTVTVQ